MESQSLLTSNYRLDAASRFVTSVADNNYYFFVGNHLNPNTVVQPVDNTRDTLLNTYYNMIFGKLVKSNDVNLMVKRHDYVANTVYAMYDHGDPYIYTKNFYVMVLEGTQYDVFKCLDNNQGAASVVSPSRSNVNLENDDFYYPTDGYRWKYLYSVDKGTASKFMTPDYFPVYVDTGVQAQAVPGAIDVISVKSSGKGYSNYITGQFTVGDIRLNGDAKTYAISNPHVNTANGFYDACWIYITSGAGSGQYRMIDSYTSNSTYNSIKLIDAFDSNDPPVNGSTFEIYPSVKIVGDGYQTIDAHARAIIEPTGNTVDHVEMLDRGQDYRVASAAVMYSASVGVTQTASLVPIYSPTNGHGYNPPAELAGHYVGVSVKLVGNESNTVITGNDYSQWGLLKNPQFNKVSLGVSSLNQQFSTNELVYKINPLQVAVFASTVKNSNNVITNQLNVQNTDPSKIVNVGDQLVVSYSNTYMLANVYSVSNTAILLDASATFNTAGSYSANVYIANASSSGLVDGFSANNVVLTQVDGQFVPGDEIIGAETGTHGIVSALAINDKVKSYSTFIQAYTYIGTMAQGTFTSDEQVFQIANAVASARFHSLTPDPVSGKSKIYVTHQLGIFNTSIDDPLALSSQITGYSSGAIATLTNKYLPDLVFGSGDVVYLENFYPITRSDEKTETFQLILDF